MDDETFPPWFSANVRWLSAHKGKGARLTCERCDLRKAYRVDDILAQEGDIAVKSVPGMVAGILGCKRIAETVSWKRCLIKCEILDIRGPSDQPRFSVPNDMDRLPEISLREVPANYAIFAACRCGRIHFIDVRPFLKSNPDLTTKGLAVKLSCRRCGNKQGNALLYMHMPR